ncbi:prolipoprotein diacylglyceryl transferase [Candidatus Collierbacteria bacterium]|nr:prolipoprotein diacylglyceryl transferase [Candidatus Collierbacteria bacterium]
MSIDIFGIAFHPYGFVLGLGILAGLQASLWLAKRRKIPVQLIEQLFWWVVIGGIIGARAYHVIDKWQEIYSLNPQSVFYLWNGGLGIWGAIGGGVIGLLGYWVIKSRMKINFFVLVDVVMFGVPLGQAIGRWGNFFNNEIVGKNGEPLFLYESGLSFVLFVILVKLVKLDKFGKEFGNIAGVYLIGYGLIRFLLEPLRPEAIVWKIGIMPTASMVSLVAIVTGIFLTRATRKR